MPKVSRDTALAIGGLVLTIVLLVLDKAEKLKGPALYWLLALAALMTLPLALSIPSVADASGARRYWARALAVGVVGLVYCTIGIWISPTKRSVATSTIPTEPVTTVAKPPEQKPHIETHGTTDKLEVKVQRHGTEEKVAAVAGKPSLPNQVGAITQGPCSVTQIGGQGNQAATNCGIVRSLTPQEREELVENLKKGPPGIATVCAVETGQDLGTGIYNALKAAGWQMQEPEIQLMFLGKPMHEDVDVFVHGEPGEIGQPAALDPSTETLVRSLAVLKRFKFAGPGKSEQVAKGVVKISVGPPLPN